MSGPKSGRPRMAVIALSLSCVLLASSCGKSKIPVAKGTRLPVFPVKGTVEMNGKPLAGAAIRFYPLRKLPDGVSAILPHAWTAADGSFTVSTYAENDGAPAGKYRVTVRSNGPGLVRDDDPDLIPPPYNSAKSSRLFATVEEGENDLPPLKLELTPEQAAKLTPENPDASQAGS